MSPDGVGRIFPFCAHWNDSVQFSSVTQLCPILCDPMDCSMPGLPCLSTPSNAESGHFSAPNSFMLGWLATVKENPSKFPGKKWAQAAAEDSEKGLLFARVDLPWTWTSSLTKIVNNASFCTWTQWGQTKWNRKKKKKKGLHRAKQEEWVVCVQNPQTPWWFVGDVIGKITSENVVLFWLVSFPELLCSGWSYHPLPV